MGARIGGDGPDLLRAGNGGDRVFGGAGDDRLIGGPRRDKLHGGDGHDMLWGGAGDELFGGAGDDRLEVRGPRALLMPGPGRDFALGAGDSALSYADLDSGVIADLRGGWARGAQTRDAISGVTLAQGSAHDDRLLGGGAAAWEGFSGGAGNDVINGRGGHDEALYGLEGGPGGVIVNLAAGRAIDSFGDRDRLRAIEAVSGTAHDDRLTGSGAAFESFAGLAGRDLIRGGHGEDRADYSRDAAEGGRGAVRVDLARGKAIDGFGDMDRLMSIETVLGTRFADRIKGDGGANHLLGGPGADLLAGRGGRDRLEGGPGRDNLHGGAGPDVFLFAPGDGRDAILDFEAGRDRLRLSGFDGYAGFHELDLRDVRGGALLDLPGRDAVLIRGVAAEDLGPDDIWLA